jgi:hypothetical protein
MVKVVLMEQISYNRLIHKLIFLPNSTHFTQFDTPLGLSNGIVGNLEAYWLLILWWMTIQGVFPSSYTKKGHGSSNMRQKHKILNWIHYHVKLHKPRKESELM